MAFHLNSNFIKPITYRISKFDSILIVATIAITLFTRTFHLTFESLWLDELYSMCIANPAQSFSAITSDIHTDFHPPFYYYFLNSVFSVFPYNDLVGRLISAITGILGVFLMYILGNRNLWNDYIQDNFILDTVITDHINNKEVVFRYKRRPL